MHEPTALKWRALVHVRPRFQRSSRLERDACEPGSLDGYILTPLVTKLTGRIIEGFHASVPARAWSVTGPYGAGKSAFAIFLAAVMGLPDFDATRRARALLTDTDASLADAILGPDGIFANGEGLFPVLVPGERRPLDQILLRALRDSTERFWKGPGADAGVGNRIAKRADAAASGRAATAREVVVLFEETAQKVAASKQPGRGLLVVLDEADKVLDHAAQQPAHGDVQVLQELAEAANRSGNSPIVFVVLLHQALEQYAGRLSLTERGEWAKVQGRFEDLAFQEAPLDLLRLVGEAIERGPLPSGAQEKIESLAARCARLVTRGRSDDAALRKALLTATFPLHPVTALLLRPLFRSGLAQNEISLFGFLSSVEPFGFQELLDKPIMESGSPSLFFPDALYDSITASLGSRLKGHFGKQWTQIATAIQRLPEGSSELDARVLKAVGLLGLFGDAAGLAATDATLEAIYTDGADASKRALADAIERLRRASLLVFRKFRNAYQLWEGSDLDVNALMQRALGQMDATSSLVQRLAQATRSRPLVARRHLFKTGTFRYFELRIVGVSAFHGSFPDIDPNADGGVLLVIEPESSTRATFLLQLKEPILWGTAGSRPVLVAVPRDVERLLEIGAELAALEWVQANTPELADNVTAQREVTTRIADAEGQLRAEITKLLCGAVPCDWLSQSETFGVDSLRSLLRIISDLCDGAYSKTPFVQNELLNRRQLSSAAAAARRSLMEAMITHAAQPRLGLKGTPTEAAMYQSLLDYHGLHRERDGSRDFGPPLDRESGSLLPVWTEIERALDDAREARLRVPALFERLLRPPYGLRDGLLPVLLVAVLLAKKDQISLYYDGVFVPKLSDDVIDKLLQNPSKFELQYLAIRGPRAALYGRLVEVLSLGGRATSPGLVPIVRQLVRIVRELSEYARTTRSLAPGALAVREALLRAREPASLLFRDLPLACGMKPFGATGTGTVEDTEAFVERLRGAIRELRFAYPKLLDTIEDALRTGLGLPADTGAFREDLAVRAARLSPIAVEPQLQAFLALAGEAQPRDEWLAAIGALLSGKPPSMWHDQDLEQTQFTMGILIRRFSSLESMLESPEAAAAGDVHSLVRVAVSPPHQRARSLIVALRPEHEPLFGSVHAQMQEVAARLSASVPRASILAALGLVMHDLMSEVNRERHGSEQQVTP